MTDGYDLLATDLHNARYALDLQRKLFAEVPLVLAGLNLIDQHLVKAETLLKALDPVLTPDEIWDTATANEILDHLRTEAALPIPTKGQVAEALAKQIRDGNGPGQDACCDCGASLVGQVCYGAGDGSRTGKHGFFRCGDCLQVALNGG